MRTKKILITLLAITMLVGVLAGCNKNEPEVTTDPDTKVVDEATTDPESTTEPETTEPEVTTEPENTTAPETTEPATEKETTTKKQETTTKKPETTTKKPETPVTQPPVTEPPTEAQQPTTKPEKQEYVEKYPDINIEGDHYSPIRAGLYYSENGVLTTPEQLEEGDWYIYYDSYGYRSFKQKPYSPGNEPVIDFQHCPFCGKNTGDVNGHKYCAYGGCSRWFCDINCPECGVFVPANTCHTCKN